MTVTTRHHTDRSVFAVAPYHTLSNVTWQLFPVSGSYFDPRITGLILGALAAIIVMIWGPGLQGRSQEIMSP